MTAIDISKPVRLANGFQARVYERVGDQLLGAYFNPETKRWIATHWAPDGAAPWSGIEADDFRLVSAPVRHTVKVAFFRLPTGAIVTDPGHILRRAATLLGVVDVEFEEGQGIAERLTHTMRAEDYLPKETV